MKRRITILTFFVCGTVLLGGCDYGMKTTQTATTPPKPAGNDTYLDRTAIDNNTNRGNSAVDAALEWAQKYAEVSAKRDLLEEENRKLMQQNQAFQRQIDQMKLQLGQAESELGEANAMLLELRDELNRWKSNVLGFRDEMRQAQTAQIEAMHKILVLIGGEPVKQAPANSVAQSDSKESDGETVRQ